MDRLPADGLVDDVNGLIRGRLAVGMVTACTVTGLFDALAAFRREHPGVEVALVEDHSDRLIGQVRTGAADLALIGAGAAVPADLDALVVARERLIASVPPDHPLAGRKRTTLAEIRGYPLVCMPQGTGIRAVLDSACTAQGVEADIALQASAPAAVADLAARGLGVAVLSESMAAAQRDRLDPLLIEDIEELALLALVWSAGRTPSPALRALLPHCRRAFGAAAATAAAAAVATGSEG
ncbi:MAG TPA: LysR substrate-binding domain-containing protein [Actinocrinis sp.]